MVVTLSQQYNVGEKPTVILYTFSSFQSPADTSKMHRKAVIGARIYGIKHMYVLRMCSFWFCLVSLYGV